MQPNMVVGKYTGTGSTLAVDLGFTPDAVIILNQSDAGPTFIGFRGDTTNTAVSLSTTMTQITAGGMVFVDGAYGDNNTTVGRGFQVSGGTGGGAGQLSVSGKVYKYLAFRSSAGAQNKLGN